MKLLKKDVVQKAESTSSPVWFAYKATLGYYLAQFTVAAVAVLAFIVLGLLLS